MGDVEKYLEAQLEEVRADCRQLREIIQMYSQHAQILAEFDASVHKEEPDEQEPTDNPSA